MIPNGTSFSLLLQANIDNTVDMEEFRFLLTGGISTGEVPPNPLPWLGDKLWAEMNRLSSFLGFVGFAEELQKAPVSRHWLYSQLATEVALKRTVADTIMLLFCFLEHAFLVAHALS